MISTFLVCSRSSGYPASGHRRLATILSALSLLIAAESAVPGRLIAQIAATGDGVREIPVAGWMNNTDGPAISPDGRWIAYSAGGGGWAGNAFRLLDRATGVARELEGAEHGLFPFWAPDSRRLGFFVLIGPHFELRVMDLEDGAVRAVAEAPFLGMAIGATWTGDDRILYTGYGLALREVDLARCEAAPAASGDSGSDGDAAAEGDPGAESCPSAVLASPNTAAGELALLAPHVLPDGRGLVHAAVHEDGGSRLVLRTGDAARTLMEWNEGTPYFLTYAPTGHLVFNADSGLVAVPFSIEELEVTGEPALIAEGGYRPTVAADGTLAYRRIPREMHQRLKLVDRTGHTIRALGPGRERILHPVFSRDQGRIALYTVVGGNWDVWIHDVETGAASRVTRDPRADFDVTWGPSDEELVFTTFRRYPGAIARVRPGAGARPRVFELEAADRSAFAIWEPTVSPDGRHLAYYLIGRRSDIWYRDLTGDGPSREWLASDAVEFHPRFSPDGRYIAYVWAREGRFGVRVAPTPDGPDGAGAREARGEAGEDGAGWIRGGERALYPQWSPSGDELFFVRDDTLFAVTVATDGGFRTIGPPAPLFAGADVGSGLMGANTNNPTFAVAGSGDRFAIVANRSEGKARIVVAPGGAWARARGFTRVRSGAAATDRASTGGVSWVDYDMDGDLDLYVANGYTVTEEPEPKANRLYRNDGGELVPVDAGSLTAASGFSSGSTWGDYDNDGDPDVFIANQRGQDNLLYRNEGGGRFTRVGDIAPVSDGGSSFSASWIDVDGDGHLDLHVTNGGLSGAERDFLYRNHGDGTFRRITEGPVVEDSTASGAGVWADYDDDGDPDLFVADRWMAGHLTNRLYRNEGGWRFTRMTEGPVAADTVPALAAAWGDCDNDGDLDLYVGADLGTANRLYLNDGAGGFRRGPPGPHVLEPGGMRVTWADRDNDGDLDLVGHPWGAAPVVYENLGDCTFRRGSGGALGREIGYGSSLAWADYDDDGDLDLYMGNWPNWEGEGERNFLYRNDGAPGGWLKVRLAGTRSNRSAIGARVTIEATIGGRSVVQVRELAGQTGWRSQDAPELHFGLGDAESVDQLIVRWPSGATDEHGRVPAGRTVTVIEGRGVQSM